MWVTIALMTSDRAIQGVEAIDVVEAWNLTELAAAVRDCAQRGRPIVDYGRYHRGYGHRPPDRHVRIDTAPGVVAHEAADMTVRVRAATPIGELQRDLAERNQWLPIDAPRDMAIGEAVAHHVFGPLRCGFGSVRDLLLGLRFVDAAGDELAVGGRTVKNVAGYDATRCMVGSAHTLGLLTELTLRTFALPPQVTRLTLAGLTPNTIEQQLTALLCSDAAPSGLAYIDGRLELTYCGPAKTCDAQLEALSLDAPIERIDTDAADYLAAQHDRITQRHAKQGLIKLIVPPGRTAPAIEPLGERVEALFTHGVIWLSGDWSAESAAALHDKALAAVEPLGGQVVWLKRPGDSEAIPPFAPGPSDARMLRQVKRAFDPQDVFNPGRLFACDG